MFGRRKKTAALFERVRALGEPDWSRVQAQLIENERRLGAANGWFIGEGVDHPCTVFLSEFGIHIDVRPDTMGSPELISIGMYSVERCGVGTSDIGNLRLVVIFSSESGTLGVAVDFAPDDRPFAERLAGWGEMASQNRQFQQSIFDEVKQPPTEP